MGMGGGGGGEKEGTKIAPAYLSDALAYLSELIKQYHPSRNLCSQSKNLLSEIRVKSKTFGDRAFEK